MKTSASAVDRGAWSARHARKARSKVRGSTFRKPRTSDLEPPSVPLVPPVSRA